MTTDELGVLPPVVRAAHVQRSPDDAFRIFTTEIGAWWPLPTHGLFGAASGGVTFHDGQLIEHAVDGRQVVWAEVVLWEPPHRFAMTWHPGRSADEASHVAVGFEADGDGTRVVIEHRGWETFGPDAAERRRSYVGPNAWGYVLDHFADGAEPRPMPPAVGDLAAAYGTFFAEARRGGFGPALHGEWNAEQVVAHVALNDAAMIAVCQAIVHEQPARFENQTCQDPQVLQQYIQQAGDMSGLIDRGRARAAQVLAAVSRLSADQRSQQVDCHLTHDGQVVLDQPMAWEMIAITTQAGRHLPAHIEQLSNLRAGD